MLRRAFPFSPAVLRRHIADTAASFFRRKGSKPAVAKSDPSVARIPGFALPPDMLREEVQLRANYVPSVLLHELCIRLCLNVPGNIIEFGVANGASIRRFQQALARYGDGSKKLFGLDSFLGLREPFEGRAVGAFACEVPDIPGVEIIPGYFEDICTDALRARVERVAFAHLDADLNSSTLVALRWLTPLLNTGSLLLFDEFTGGGLAEARAFDQWRRETGIALIRIAEFDRMPSAGGTVVDRRLLFQVIGSESLSFHPAL